MAEGLLGCIQECLVLEWLLHDEALGLAGLGQVVVILGWGDVS